ncbi:MAG: hypothetical protein K9J48_05340, partial [Desulfohalobiaceae bacterium]|nr:hypothetical protein [Desulfohalobiaceae bacterium]
GEKQAHETAQDKDQCNYVSLPWGIFNRQDAKDAKGIAKGRYFALRERPQSKERLRCRISGRQAKPFPLPLTRQRKTLP